MKDFAELSISEKKMICDMIINRRFYLLLGSGVSGDSLGMHGKMRLAGKLREDLVALKELPYNASLQQAYSALSPDDKIKEITESYTCIEPGSSVRALADIPWRRVYTLNVDDCFESAFESVIRRREFEDSCLQSINYSDGFSELTGDVRCSVVHLHGSVRSSDDGYIFSRNEYAKSIVQPNSWMMTLSQLIRSEAFVVAGTSFDEIDFEYYLELRNQRTVRQDYPPSILVEPFPNVLTEKLCHDHSFCLFRGTVEAFVAELVAVDDRIKDAWIDNANDGLAGLGLPQADRLRFAANFDVVPDSPSKVAAPARFLLGAELSWEMVAAGADVSREKHPIVRDQVLQALEDPAVRLMLVIDQPGSGKTAFLKRLAFDLSRGSRQVFWFLGVGLELDHKKIAGIINRINEDLLIFVDNFADCLNSISLIMDNVTKKNILFVGAERDYRLSYVENSLTSEEYLQVRDVLGLSSSEANKLRAVHDAEGISTIQNLGEKRYLGEVVGRSIAEACCRIQRNFKTIDRITGDLLEECLAEEIGAYISVALAKRCFSLGVRRSVLSTLSDAGVVEFLLSENAPLPLKYSDRSCTFVAPKHPLISDRVLEDRRQARSRELLYAFVDLAKSISPRVNPSSIKIKTPDAQLLGRLMDYDNNVRRYIDDYAEEYYSLLRDDCGWNARYWEQLALLKLDRYLASPTDDFLLEESIQHARSAISAEVHPFSLTTLAKVLFEAMSKKAERRDQFFQEAWINICEANEREARWSSRGATLFAVCFSGVMRFIELGGQLSGQQYEELRDMISTTHRLKIKDRSLLERREKLVEILA